MMVSSQGKPSLLITLVARSISLVMVVNPFVMGQSCKPLCWIFNELLNELFFVKFIINKITRDIRSANYIIKLDFK